MSRTLWALSHLPGEFLRVRVVSPDGVVLNEGGWIHRPTEISMCRRQRWYLREYGLLPAIDLNWLAIEGATSVWPIRWVTRQGLRVLVTGPRGQALFSGQEVEARPASCSRGLTLRQMAEGTRPRRVCG
jgi:hypothetical protein